MADEAILRIVLDDSGGTPVTTPVPPAPTNPPPPAPPKPPPPPTERLQLTKGAINKASTSAAENAPAPPPKPPSRDWMRDLVDGIAGANRHALVEGGTGSGKSSTARNIAFERAKQGEEVNVLDPHKPEMWKGVSKVFTRDTAADFSKMMLDTLREREKASVSAASRGEKIDFKPITFALSDFAAIAKDFPKLKDTMQTMLTEGRKFNIAVLAETAGFNAEEIGPGTEAMRRSFGQKVQMLAPGPGQPDRTAKIGGETFVAPDLSAAADTNKERFDPSIVQYKSAVPKAPPEEPEPAFNPIKQARERRDSERRAAQVDEAYKGQYGDRDKKNPMDAVFNVVNSMRGTIGGLFGTLTGAAIDVVQGVRKASAENEKKEYNKQLLSEGSPTAQAVQTPQGIPVPKADQLVQPPKTAQIVPTPEAKKIEPSVSSLGDIASTVGSKMAMIVPAIVAATVAFNAITGALDTSVKRYEEYSPDIAQAQANVEVNKTMNDLRRSQEHGPELARYVEAQGRMQEKFEEAKMKFLMRIAPTIEGLINILGNIAEEFGNAKSAFNTVLNLFNPMPAQVGELVKIKREELVRDKTGEVPDPTEILFKGNPGAEIPEV